MHSSDDDNYTHTQSSNISSQSAPSCVNSSWSSGHGRRLAVDSDQSQTSPSLSSSVSSSARRCSDSDLQVLSAAAFSSSEQFNAHSQTTPQQHTPIYQTETTLAISDNKGSCPSLLTARTPSSPDDRPTTTNSDRCNIVRQAQQMMLKVVEAADRGEEPEELNLTLEKDSTGVWHMSASLRPTSNNTDRRINTESEVSAAASSTFNELGYGDSDGADSDTADTILDLSLSPSMINAYSQLTCNKKRVIQSHPVDNLLGRLSEQMRHDPRDMRAVSGRSSFPGMSTKGTTLYPHESTVQTRPASASTASEVSCPSGMQQADRQVLHRVADSFDSISQLDVREYVSPAAIQVLKNDRDHN